MIATFSALRSATWMLVEYRLFPSSLPNEIRPSCTCVRIAGMLAVTRRMPPSDPSTSSRPMPTSKIPAIVVAGPDQGPGGMGLAFDVGGGGIVLRVERLELLIEPVLGRDARIDRAADRFD